MTYRVVRADRTAPAITVDSPREGAVYLLGESVTSSYGCTDEPFGSGLEACEGDRPSGATLDTQSVGPHSFTVRARDRAGNKSSVTRNYRVVYRFDGFLAPLADFPEFSSLDAGETVPVKFSLGGNQGLAVLAAGSPTWTAIDCSSGTPLGAASSPQKTLSYYAATDRYLLRVESDAAWRGTCRQLGVTLADGMTHRANVRFD